MIKTWQEVTSYEDWEKLGPETSFLQSFTFGEFHKKLGHHVWRLGLENGEGKCQVVEMVSKTGKFFYIPGGPVLSNWQEDLPSLVGKLVQLGKNEDVSFIRFDPRVLSDKEVQELEKLNLKKAPFYTQPQASLVLDLTKPLEDLRHALSESTRYNIGWVARQGVKVTVSEDESEVEQFLTLLEETSTRQGFRLTDRNYYKEQFLTFFKDGQAKLFLTRGAGEFEGKVLAAAIVIYYGKTVTYLHAASSSLAPKLRAPYLQQWSIIEDAKENGFTTYDFWGVSANDDPKDPWAGVSAFKQSFGGEKVFYQKPYDLILKKSYYVQNFLERLRKLLYKQR